jgi:hypothetical protein
MRTQAQVGLALLIGWWALAPSQAGAQTCTVGPLTSSTALSSVSSAINSAANGSVVCLQRGQTWSSSTGLTLNTYKSNSARVTICASSGSACSDTGGANPRFTITGGGACVQFSNSGGGLNFMDVDCYSGNGSNTASAWQMPGGTRDVTIDGGVIDGFFRGAFFGSTNNMPSNIRFGVCGGPGHWVEIRNGPSSMPDGDRHSMYGAIANSSIATYVHHFSSSGGNHVNTSHYHDIGDGGGTWNQNNHDLTIECGLYQMDKSIANNIGTSMLKINRGYNLVIRDNTFQVVNGTTSVAGIAFASHAAGGTEGVSGNGVNGAGAQVYRNKFLGTSGVYNELGADIDVFNNIFDFTSCSGDCRGVMRQHYQAAASDDVPISNVRIFNNTIYKGGGPTAFPVLSSDNPGTPTRPLPKNNAIFNNLIYDVDSGTASIFTASQTGCNGYGSNGANIRNNFIYTPNDSSPEIWSCSGASGNSASPYNVSPGLPGVGAGDFSLASGSVLLGRGIGAGAPIEDYAKNPRPSPPSIGAYDLGAGGVPPLQPPTLINITSN